MRKIIVLSSTLQQDGTTQLSYVFWLLVPVALQVANALATSKVSDATAAELTALQNGSVAEQVLSTILSAGFVQADAGVVLTRGYNAAQLLLTSQGSAKQYKGATWDGTSWSNLPA